jgi:hypothetical protein
MQSSIFMDAGYPPVNNIDTVAVTVSHNGIDPIIMQWLPCDSGQAPGLAAIAVGTPTTAAPTVLLDQANGQTLNLDATPTVHAVIVNPCNPNNAPGSIPITETFSRSEHVSFYGADYFFGYTMPI